METSTFMHASNSKRTTSITLSQRNLKDLVDNDGIDNIEKFSSTSEIETSNRGKDERLMRYKLLLSEILLSSGKKSSKTHFTLQLLNYIQEKEGISKDDHELVLSSLGWTLNLFDEFLKGNTKAHEITCRDDNHEDIHGSNSISVGSDRDLCKVCFTNEINCILLPCEHFAVCKDCGLKLDYCPFDREIIKKIQSFTRI